LVVPAAIPPSMAYRWEMDLSPGRRTEPDIPCAGRIKTVFSCGILIQYSGNLATRIPGSRLGQNPLPAGIDSEALYPCVHCFPYCENCANFLAS